MELSRLREPIRTITGQLNTKRMGPINNLNNNIKLYRPTFKIYNDKQNKKRTAEDLWQNVIPAKKINTNSTNSYRTERLLTHENINTQESKYVNTNKGITKNTNDANICHDLQKNSKGSNTDDKFTGLFYLKYYDNIAENMHQKELSSQDANQSFSTREKLVQDNNVKHFKNPEPMKKTFINTQDVNKLTVYQRLGPKVKENGTKVNKCTKSNISKKCSLLSNNSNCSNILHSNVPPTEKMQQRMAEALEGIVYITTKSILNRWNTKYSSVKLFMSFFEGIIDERIEKVLMGQPVGSRSDIIDRYLETYPIEKDTELKELLMLK